ncbi:4-hydroxy-tetrahydrodipicolinate reductase [Homoserinimonas hongtaonis]|uniref:4-hydroxy-tetrahydrodipicolinate reductase n=1 Tax=Homoserinimonas hongtaonis TaxID=2079791 RepID=A0A2U1SXD8_9MICO|nr:4-hydroxy-tetrahydrodipicolinate reductase [Salinibacterium hongtaonis]
MTLTVAVVGANGRMGKLVSGIIEANPAWELVAQLGSSSPREEMLAADVVVDVTNPAVSPEIVTFALEHGRNVLVGTSGWSADRIDSLRATVQQHPDSGVIIVPNFSLGSVLATRLATVAARFFDSIEIIEAHHAAKVDSPSGTAVRTAELMAKAREDLGPVSAPHADQLARGQQVASIPIHSLRLQGVVARQEVIFGGTGEVLSVAHDTLSQDAYAHGITVAIGALRDARGVTVGLEQLLDLDGTEQAAGAVTA